MKTSQQKQNTLAAGMTIPNNNESWNDPRDFAKPLKAIFLPKDVLSTSEPRLIKLENQVQCLMEAYLAHKSSVQVNKIASSCEICSDLEQTLEDEFKDLHLNLLVLEVLSHALMYNAILDKYVKSLELDKNGFAFNQDMEKDPTTSLLVGRGFLATANDVIDCKKAKIVVGERVTRWYRCPTPFYARKDLDYHFPGEWKIARDAELNPFKDVLVFRKMVEFLGALPINLKGNMWESEELIKEKIDWNMPLKERDDAWHIRIKLIDPDEERFKKIFQSVPTTRKLFKKENPNEIISFDHLHDF
nr:MAK10-like protein [Tanacetum cinerariifolium]